MHYFQPEPNIFCADKPVGWTPLQALEELRKLEQIPTSTPLTYAGRLDPMAEGLLLILAGPRVHEKESFLKLNKEYEVTALIGIETDSHDLLGLPVANSGQSRAILENSEQLLTRALATFLGPVSLPLPAFSSPPVQGKPLFWWKRNKPNSVEQPIRTTAIHSITNISTDTIKASELLNYIHRVIPQVNGDFRQEEIVQHWDELLSGQELNTVSFTVDCESGTYIRSLVHELGQKLGTGACVYTLRRTKVADFSFD